MTVARYPDEVESLFAEAAASGYVTGDGRRVMLTREEVARLLGWAPTPEGAEEAVPLDNALTRCIGITCTPERHQQGCRWTPESAEDLPTLGSLVGSMPNLTGGLSPEEYLRRNRAGDAPESAESEHLTFRVSDGQRCFANCPACAPECADREVQP
jgi:hypothetical protein